MEILMGEASTPSWKSKSQKMNKLITESDMEAAQQLIQLSDEDNSCNTSISSGKRDRRTRDEEVDQIRLSDKIREIFGEDHLEAAFKPKKQRRYRSLVNIYGRNTHKGLKIKRTTKVGE